MVEYFGLVYFDKTKETLDVTLEEHDDGVDGYKPGQLCPNGFHEKSFVRDYPVRGFIFSPTLPALDDEESTDAERSSTGYHAHRHQHILLTLYGIP